MKKMYCLIDSWLLPCSFHSQAPPTPRPKIAMQFSGSTRPLHALDNARLLKSLPFIKPSLGYESLILEGLSLMSLGQRLQNKNLQIYNKFTDINDPRKIIFTQLLGDYLRKCDKRVAIELYSNALNEEKFYMRTILNYM